MPALSREYRMYLALWRKAYRAEDPSTIKIKCPNRHMAIIMRQGMYRAIKPFREAREIDNELFKACEALVVSLEMNEDKYDPHYLTFQARRSIGILESQFDFSEEDLLTGDERRVFDDVEELLKATDPEKAEKRSTPFYEREA